MPTPSLAEVVDILAEIAPLELAAEWDNTGLLLQPNARPGKVARALLCIDLLPAVVDEAIAAKADLVVAYHPPIWKPLKRLCADGGVTEALLRAAAAKLCVYSPHTALDAAPNGLADWLVECVLGGAAPKELRAVGEGEFGRMVTLGAALPFRTLLQRCKRKFGVRTLAVARPAKAKSAVRTVAVAAGAGAGVLRGTCADVWVTGEVSHHDALAALAAGTTVVTAGHSNTERGFLPVLRRRLVEAFDGDLEVRVAKADHDPFVVV